MPSTLKRNPKIVKLKAEILELNKECAKYYAKGFWEKSMKSSIEARTVNELKKIRDWTENKLNWLEYDSGPGWRGGGNPYG